MNFISKWIFHPQWKIAEENALYGNPSPYFRKEFHVAGKIIRAQLQLTALGICKAKINGEYVSCDRFVPGLTDYNKRIYYETFDITKLLSCDNCITVVLGDGWYMGRLGLTFKRNHYGDTPALRAQIIIETDDCKKIEYGTDETWKCAFGAIKGNDFFNGEIWDSREIDKKADFVGYDDSTWSQSKIYDAKKIVEPQELLCNGISVSQELDPVCVVKKENSVIYDFGQNIAGVLKIALFGDSGDKIVVRHGETLRPNGELYVGNLRTVLATDTYM